MPTPMAQVPRQRDLSRWMPSTFGSPVRHQQRIEHRDDADDRADRQVDVARHDHEDHARSHDRDDGTFERQGVTMLTGARFLPPVAMPKPIQIAASATSMPNNTQVDFRLVLAATRLAQGLCPTCARVRRLRHRSSAASDLKKSMPSARTVRALGTCSVSDEHSTTTGLCPKTQFAGEAAELGAAAGLGPLPHRWVRAVVGSVAPVHRTGLESTTWRR